MAQKIVAFVAKSFAPEDEAKTSAITKFLESFISLGFIPQSAERSEVESVSEKVRYLIDESDVLVGIFTRRHPVYQFQGRLATAISLIRGRFSPSIWSAPPWVLQESGYALKGKKSLILFREADVEIPGLQGDLEYIPFDPQNPAPALQRASEMINGLIAKKAGIRVETSVYSEGVAITEPEVVLPPNPPEDKTAPAEGTDEGSFQMQLFDLIKVAASRDWEKAQRQYEDGLQWVNEHEPDRIVAWKSFYWRTLFGEGRTDALDRLRDLSAENKADYLPLSHLASCFVELGEYDKAVKQYLDAASIAQPDKRASLEITAAETLQKAKKVSQAKELLLRVRGSDYAKKPKTQFRILKCLYSLSNKSEDRFGSFAIGELALHQSPEESDFRFALAFDYGVAGQSHLSMYHYKIICLHDEKNAGALNNLGIALSNCELPVLAVQCYKKSYDLGETLAASNLGRRYLDSGLADEAISLLKSAQAKENCVPEVARTLASAHEQIEENNRQQENVQAQAEEHREFLLSFSEGLLSPTPTNLDGKWSFPPAEIDVKRAAAALSGARENREQVDSSFGLSALFPGSATKYVTKIERFEFSATLTGRTCKFKLETSTHEEPQSLGFLGLPSFSTTEGYILFAEDGRSGRVAELKHEKLEKFYTISKST